MKRKLLVLLCLVAITSLLFTSCGVLSDIIGGDDSGDVDNPGPDTGDQNGGDEVCDHTFADKWSANSIEHWHAPTCEHTSLKADAAEHYDTNEDGACDVCAYEIGHEHTFFDAWVSDATHHWKEASCSHTGEKSDLAPHTDTNSDGSCDACEAHVHVLDIFGKCTVCGEQVEEADLNNIGAMISAVVAGADKISGGTLNSSYVSSTASIEGYIRNDVTLIYRFGVGSAYYKADYKSYNYGNTAATTQESWYQLVDADKVFGVYQQTNGGVKGDFFLDGGASLNNLQGYYFAVSTLTNAYGAEELLENIYAASQHKFASEYNCENDNGKYSFSFNYLYVNSETGRGETSHVDYYEVEVSFAVSDDGALTALDVVCDCYTNSLENDSDNDYDYDPNTNTVTMRDNAAPDTYTFSITQEQGERNYVSEHPRSEFIPESFDLFTDPECTNKVSDTVSATVGEVFRLYLGNFAPQGTSISYVADNFTIFCAYADAICFSNAMTSSVLINIKTEGVYTFIITAGDVVKEITVNATAEQEKPVDPTPAPDNSIGVEITDTYAWDKDLAEFTAPADGDYTFTVPKGAYIGACTEGESIPWADYYVLDRETNLPAGGEITVSLKKGESYKFYVSSPEKNIIVYILYTVSDYSGEQGGDTDPIIPEKTYITVGTHTVGVTEADIVSEAIDFLLEVTDEGTYTFTGEGVFANFYASNGMLVSRNTAYLVADTYTVSIYVGALAEAGDITFTLEYSAPVSGGDDNDDIDEPDVGTPDNPIVIDSLPFETTLGAGADLYYSYVPAVDCDLIIVGAYAAGEGYESISSFDDNGVLLFTTVYGVKAENTLILNLWNVNPVEASVTVSAAGEDPTPEPDPTLTGLEGNFDTVNVYNTNVRVLIDSTTINIVDPEGRVTTFTYTYVDGVFEVYYKGNKLPNTSDPKFTIKDGVMTSIYNNGNYYTLVPTDEEIIIEDGKNEENVKEPDGTVQYPFVLETLPETITFNSNTTSKVYYIFTAEKSGTFTITWQRADSWSDIYELDADGNNTANNTSKYSTKTISLEVKEGVTYRFSLGTWSVSGETTVSLDIT